MYRKQLPVSWLLEKHFLHSLGATGLSFYADPLEVTGLPRFHFLCVSFLESRVWPSALPHALSRLDPCLQSSRGVPFLVLGNCFLEWLSSLVSLPLRGGQGRPTGVCQPRYAGGPTRQPSTSSAPFWIGASARRESAGLSCPLLWPPFVMPQFPPRKLLP